MINLYDSEIVAAYRVVNQLTRKYGRRTWGSFTEFNRLSDELEREAVAKLFDIGLIARVNTLPMFSGDPPVIEIEGRLNPAAFDHERKRHEILKARERGETIHGESEVGE